MSPLKKTNSVATILVAAAVVAIIISAWGRDEIFRIHITQPIESTDSRQNMSSATKEIPKIGSDVKPDISLKLQRYLDSIVAPQARVIHEVSRINPCNWTLSACHDV